MTIYLSEIHSLYPSSNIVKVNKSRRLRWAGHVARMEESRRAFKILTGKPTGKRSLGRPGSRWKDNIRMELEEIGINEGNWVDSAQHRDYWRALVNAALNLRVSKSMELVKPIGRHRGWMGEEWILKKYTSIRSIGLIRLRIGIIGVAL